MNKIAKSVTNILKLLPTHFVSNICHQHRCSLYTAIFFIMILSKDVIFVPELGDLVSQKWYSEIEHWSFRTHGPKETSPPNVHTGYFSAMLWRSTTRFGIGLSEHNGMLFIVARYYPHPNSKGEFEKNVLPLKDINDMYDGTSMEVWCRLTQNL